LTCRIDHLVITAPDLAAGAEFVRRAIGVAPEAGGEHARMGTHNLLLKLGDSAYLEVIAPDPRAAKPGRRRWFQLDDPEWIGRPRLATWVARTTDLRSTMAAASEPLGEIEPMSRGELGWLITIPVDGTLPFGGAAPALIEWNGPPPGPRLREAGCSLINLEIFHPQARRISALLESISFEGAVSVAPERPGLVAHVQTPDGSRVRLA
jgi:hypothetical protein